MLNAHDCSCAGRPRPFRSRPDRSATGAGRDQRKVIDVAVLEPLSHLRRVGQCELPGADGLLSKQPHSCTGIADIARSVGRRHSRVIHGRVAARNQVELRQPRAPSRVGPRSCTAQARRLVQIALRLTAQPSRERFGSFAIGPVPSDIGAHASTARSVNWARPGKDPPRASSPPVASTCRARRAARRGQAGADGSPRRPSRRCRRRR